MGRVPEYDPLSLKGPILSALAWAGRQRSVTWFLVNIGNKIDPLLMKVSGGRLKSTLHAPTVLLTHTGAKSGKKRSTPLTYFTDRGNVILIASRGGHRDHPPGTSTSAPIRRSSCGPRAAAAATGSRKRRATSASGSGIWPRSSTRASPGTRSAPGTAASR